MKKICVLTLFILTACRSVPAAEPSPSPLRVGVVGLAHGHVGGFLTGGALVPAGGLLQRPDMQLVGIVEPNQEMFDAFAQRLHLSPALHFHSIEEMAAQAHPAAALVFTATSEHTKIVEQCAALGIHVMMEKPLAVSYKDALAMQEAARRGKVHVLVNYETSWYRSTAAAQQLLAQGALGSIVKAVFRDGHQGPKQIGVKGEFLTILTDPKLNGGGALYDFGCYGLDLMTALMNEEEPVSVTAVTKQLQPEAYPQVDDEAEIVVNYRHAVGIIEGSWNWPFSFKQADVYGRSGYAKTLDADTLEVRHGDAGHSETTKSGAVPAPFDDPLHYLAAVLRGEIAEESSFTSLKTNVTVSEILDAARESARSGKSIALPLEK